MSTTINKKVPTELGTEKIGKLLMQYAIPAIIAQTAASLYNMIDSVFIGHIPDVGADAISGLATTFPFMNLSAAFGALVGVGGATQFCKKYPWQSCHTQHSRRCCFCRNITLVP